MSKIVRVVNALGRGTVLSAHDTIAEALRETPRDKDGCKAEGTCYWRAYDGVQVGDRVSLGPGP